MIESLKRFEKDIYAGLLAKTALKLTGNLSAGQRSIVENEDTIMQSVIQELTNRYNLDTSDSSYTEKLGNILDIEIDTLMSGKADEKVLLKLAEKAELPSDLYKVEIIQNIKDFYGSRYQLEKPRIIATVKQSDRELHFGPPEKEGEPFLISLFAKAFLDDFPHNNFTLLVVGQRNKLTMNVHQVWRIYHDLFPAWQSLTLIDLLESFANRFGIEMEMNGSRGKFFLTDDRAMSKTYNIKLIPETDKSGKPHATSYTFSQFIQNKPGSFFKQASLIVAIDLEKYKSLVNGRKW
jgi:hypothetical protein